MRLNTRRIRLNLIYITQSDFNLIPRFFNEKRGVFFIVFFLQALLTPRSPPHVPPISWSRLPPGRM